MSASDYRRATKYLAKFNYLSPKLMSHRTRQRMTTVIRLLHFYLLNSSYVNDLILIDNFKLKKKVIGTFSSTTHH